MYLRSRFVSHIQCIMAPPTNEEIEIIDCSVLLPSQPPPARQVNDQPVSMEVGEKRTVAFSPGKPEKKLQLDAGENIHVTIENTPAHPSLETSPKPGMARKRNKRKKQMKVARETIDEGLSLEGVHFKAFASKHVTFILRKMGKPVRKLLIPPFLTYFSFVSEEFHR